MLFAAVLIVGVFALVQQNAAFGLMWSYRWNCAGNGDRFRPSPLSAERSPEHGHSVVGTRVTTTLKCDSYKGVRYKLIMYDRGDFSTMQSRYKHPSIVKLNMTVVEDTVDDLREELLALGQPVDLLGMRRSDGIEGMVASLSQPTDGQLLYPTLEAQAAQLLYYVIKGDPFIDGSKRIAVSLFVKFLQLNQYLVDESGSCVLDGSLLLNLAITVAESRTEEHEKVLKSIIALLVRESTPVEYN
jgi:prophage maintenance system killer protein